MPRLFLAAALVASLAGCKSDNPQSCELPGNQGTGACTDAGNPTKPECKADPDCAGKAGGPVCDTAQNKCVQCTANDNKCDANSTAPHCDATAETCVACVDDNDCSAGAGTCLPSGGCATPDTIIHATSVTANTDPLPSCGDGTHKPCTLDDALSLASSNPAKKVIRLDDNGTFTPAQNNFAVNVDLTIEAHTATLHKKNDGPILKVTNAKSLTLLGGTIEGATNTNGDGIACDASSILIVQGTTIQNNRESAVDSLNCTVTIVGAKLQNNSNSSNTFPGLSVSGGSITISRSFIVGNQGGGISTANNAAFQIVGNAILANGSQSNQGSPQGGIAISPPPTNSGSRLDFNTIAANNSNNIVGSGVQCLAGNFIAQNNIIWNNSNLQLNGCMYAYSVIGPTAISGILDGGNNTNADPKLTSTTADPHIQAGSSASKAANPNADLTGIAARDIDGDARAKPADIGADQSHSPGQP